jgi:hypothetical protein
MGDTLMKYIVVVLTAITLCSCFGNKTQPFSGRGATGEAFAPIDIKAPKFFWFLRPWKEGKLATIDGWGRYAEISFIGANKIKINPLVNFPRAQMDRRFLTWPEAGLIASTTGKMHHLAAVDDKKTKSHVPLLSWVDTELPPVLLKDGLVGYPYFAKGDDDNSKKLFVYNYKEDKMVYESPDGFTSTLEIAMNDRYALYNQYSFAGRKRVEKAIFYNWQDGEIIENDLTKELDRTGVLLNFHPCRNIHIARRYLFGYSDLFMQYVKISWDEEYSDVKAVPLSYLVPKGKGLNDFVLSSDGAWGTTYVEGYEGLRGEDLYKRAFFHMDGRYPNGISMPVITDDYEDHWFDYSAFVQHPVHGMCHAQEWRKEGKQYLRLYKMDDVLAEINRQLLEGNGTVE